MSSDALSDALMWHLEVEPCEHVTWGTNDSPNELAAAILADLQASGWTLVRATSVSARLDEIEARYNAQVKASNARIAELLGTALMGTD